jgi:D-3-phosphoglycerate dehydrogenase/gluconate 2-dehydrogenase
MQRTYKTATSLLTRKFGNGEPPQFLTGCIMTKIIQSLVAICGPQEAGPFLNRLADELGGRGAECLVHLGTMAAAMVHPRWPEVKVLVSYAIGCTGRDMDHSPALRAIIVPSLGFDGIDLDAASQRRILVANGQVSENFDSVAEAAFLLILTALYDIRSAEQRMHEGKFRTGPPTATTLCGKTVGIIGFGNIAQRLIRRLANWGVTILIHARSIHSDRPGLRFVELKTLLQCSDIVLPLVNLSPETHHLLNRERLLLMREDALLVNLSRGAVVEETALCDPAVSGRLRAVALDVFENEPLPINSPLRNLPNFILTGHEIAHTRENLDALFRKSVENVVASLEDRIPDTALNYPFPRN